MCLFLCHSPAVCLSVCSKVIVVLCSTNPISYHGNWATLNILICSPDTVRSDEQVLSSFSWPGFPICVLMRQPIGDRLGIQWHKGCRSSSRTASKWRWSTRSMWIKQLGELECHLSLWATRMSSIRRAQSVTLLVNLVTLQAVDELIRARRGMCGLFWVWAEGMAQFHPKLNGMKSKYDFQKMKINQKILSIKKFQHKCEVDTLRNVERKKHTAVCKHFLWGWK